MKSHNIKYLAGSVLVLMFLYSSGCTVDVAETQWEKSHIDPAEPIITGVIPADEAAAGVNTITINGQNFATDPDVNSVYFDNETADIISSSSSSIVVRRPNITSDSCIIKVVSSSALVVAKLGPYKVSQVVEQYGNFRDNLELSTITADVNGNIYVIETSSREIVKYTPDGVTSVVDTVRRQAYDAVIGPDGRMYLPGNHRKIDVVDLQTNEVSQWIQLPSGRTVKYGDFDDQGYYYCGGRRSRLVIVAPDNDQTVTDTDEMYRQDEIMGIRVHNGYVYLLVITDEPDAENPEWAVWRNQILGNGTVGNKELVLDLGQFAPTGSTMLGVTAMNFSSDGRLFLSVNSDDPLLVYDFSTQKMESLYKGILPPNCRFFSWGNDTNIYLISGDTNLGVEWTVYKVDVGVTGS